MYVYQKSPILCACLAGAWSTWLVRQLNVVAVLYRPDQEVGICAVFKHNGVQYASEKAMSAV